MIEFFSKAAYTISTFKHQAKTIWPVLKNKTKWLSYERKKEKMLKHGRTYESQIYEILANQYFLLYRRNGGKKNRKQPQAPINEVELA